MKQYRRIQITAFQRRVLITSPGADQERSESEVIILGDDSDNTVLAGSEEGREIIAETVRLLEQKLKEFSQLVETNAGSDDSI